MRLEFASCEELDDFLYWLHHRRIDEAALIPGDVTPELCHFSDVKIIPAHEAKAPAPASVDATWPYGSTPPVATPPADDDKPKRMRRKKAEIEAAKAAEAGTPAASDGAPSANANPFASTQAEANAAMSEQPASNPTALAAQAHVEQPAENIAPTPPVIDASDVHAWLVAKAAELGPVGATQHLQAARNFIAKFQMPKYNDSFKLADLPSDVMKYSDVQRAMHCAAMEYLSTHD